MAELSYAITPDSPKDIGVQEYKGFDPPNESRPTRKDGFLIGETLRGYHTYRITPQDWYHVFLFTKV